MGRQLQPKKTKVRRISRLYSCKIRFTHPSLLTRHSALVLKVGVSYWWRKMTKCVASYSQGRLGKTVLVVYMAAKDILSALHY